MKRTIISQCTRENLKDIKKMRGHEQDVLLHYQLPSGLHVYGMTQSFLPEGENQFSELWEIIVLGKEENVYGGCEGGAKVTGHLARLIHNHGVHQNVYLSFDGTTTKIGISKTMNPSGAFVMAETILADDRIWTDVCRYRGSDKEEAREHTNGIEEDAQSICDIFRTCILKNNNIESNKKDEIIKQLDALQAMLDKERKRSELIVGDVGTEIAPSSPPEDSKIKKFEEIRRELQELGNDEEVYKMLEEYLLSINGANSSQTTEKSDKGEK